ncbi:MAG TPA: hypothetical protein VHJ20_07925 [Polyangia bacterium]|nr:hypothetical protein [Polyangia bacterium]
MDSGPVLSVLPVILGGAAALGSAVAWWRQPSRRARRALERVGEVPLGALAEGERARVRGTARRSDDELIAPITARRCIGYRAVVEESDGNGHWKVVAREERCLAFDLAAEGLAARVEGPFLFGLNVDARAALPRPLPEAVLARFGRDELSSNDVFGRLRTFRYQEALLEHGDPVWVLGRASITIDPRGQAASLRGPPLKPVLRGAAGEPTVLADEDQPGLPPLSDTPARG